MVSAIPTPRSGGGSIPRNGRPWTMRTSSTSGGKARTTSTPQESERAPQAGARVWASARPAPNRSPPGTTIRHAWIVTQSPRSSSPELSAITPGFRKVWKNSDIGVQRMWKRVSSQRPMRTRGRKSAT